MDGKRVSSIVLGVAGIALVLTAAIKLLAGFEVPGLMPVAMIGLMAGIFLQVYAGFRAQQVTKLAFTLVALLCLSAAVIYAVIACKAWF